MSYRHPRDSPLINRIMAVCMAAMIVFGCAYYVLGQDPFLAETEDQFGNRSTRRTVFTDDGGTTAEGLQPVWLFPNLPTKNNPTTDTFMSLVWESATGKAHVTPFPELPGLSGSGGGTSDHGALTGLLDDDHPQYRKETDRLEDIPTDGAAGTAPVSTGSGAASMTDVATQAELNSHAGTGTAHHAAPTTSAPLANTGGYAFSGDIDLLSEDDTVTSDSFVWVDRASDNTNVKTRIRDLPVTAVGGIGGPGNARAVSVFNSSALTIPDNTITALTFDSESYDTDGMHSVSVNTNRLVAPVAGYYLITANAAWSFAAGGVRQLAMRDSGGVYIANAQTDDNDGRVQFIAKVLFLEADDWVEIVAFQTSGGNMTLLKLQTYSPSATMTLLPDGHDAVQLAGLDYITQVGQVLTLGLVDYETDMTGGIATLAKSGSTPGIKLDKVGSAANTAALSPSTAASTGSGGAWANPTNVTASDDSRAIASLAGSTTSQNLDVTGFNPSIPTTASIKGWRFRVERSLGAGAGSITDSSIQTLFASGVAGDDKASANPWPTAAAEATATYGGATDTWGVPSATPADINSASFGVRIVAVSVGSNDAQVDHVTLEVWYEDAGVDYYVYTTTADNALVIGRGETFGDFDIFKVHADGTVEALVSLEQVGNAVLDTTYDPFFGRDTDDLSEGATNLYSTRSSVYEQVKAILQQGSGMVITPSDGAEEVTLASTGGGAGASSPLTTKGDIWVFDSIDARLPIGSDGELLVADSGVLAGMAWESAEDAVGALIDSDIAAHASDDDAHQPPLSLNAGTRTDIALDSVNQILSLSNFNLSSNVIGVLDESNIDSAIARDSELHDAATVAAGKTYFSVTGQEFDLDEDALIAAAATALTLEDVASNSSTEAENSYNLAAGESFFIKDSSGDEVAEFANDVIELRNELKVYEQTTFTNDGGASSTYVSQIFEVVGAGGNTAATAPTAASSEGAGTFGFGEWNNPTNIFTSNDTDSLAAIASGSPGISENLQATAFGFAIPSGSLIERVELRIERAANSNQVIEDGIIQLLYNGSLIGDNLAVGDGTVSTGDEWTTTDTVVLYGDGGNPTVAWGVFLTATIINDSTFGAQVTAYNLDGIFPRQALIDHLTLTVYYDDGGAKFYQAIDTDGNRVFGVGGPLEIDLHNYMEVSPAGGVNFPTATSLTEAGNSVVTINEIDSQAEIEALAGAAFDDDDLTDNPISDLSNVSATAPSTNEVLKWNGSAWAPATDATGGGGGGSGESAIDTRAVHGTVDPSTDLIAAFKDATSTNTQLGMDDHAEAIRSLIEKDILMPNGVFVGNGASEAFVSAAIFATGWNMPSTDNDAAIIAHFVIPSNWGTALTCNVVWYNANGTTTYTANSYWDSRDDGDDATNGAPNSATFNFATAVAQQVEVDTFNLTTTGEKYVVVMIQSNASNTNTIRITDIYLTEQ